MLLPFRRLLVPVFAISLAAGGLAYAAADNRTALDVASQTANDSDSPQALDVGDEGDLQTQNGETEPDARFAPTGSSGVTSTGRSTEGCPEGFSGNHGQFVSGIEDRPRNEAAHSPCGKPLASVHDDEVGEDQEAPGAHGRARAEEAKSAEHGNGHANGHDK